ncbi:MAG: hypothetical protein A4E53_00386 [Pelotomaculum sp. PtaB.Bin104]|nr:MAG: hypothetical protein A4E53_00386 [Pelotomaculum sp. PtaB.Bin104]
MKRLKKKQVIMQEALSQGINGVGRLAKIVYQTAPSNKKARIQAAKLRYQVQGDLLSQ